MGNVKKRRYLFRSFSLSATSYSFVRHQPARGRDSTLSSNCYNVANYEAKFSDTGFDSR